MKKVIIASQNPIKIEATKLGFEKMFPQEIYNYKGIKVDSGVGKQPMTDLETFQGASNRAKAAQVQKPQADYWIGIEGGIEVVDGKMRTFAWVVITSKSNLGQAKTGTFYLPPKITELIKEGKELGEADDIVFGRTNSKYKNGAVGLLTHNLINRSSYYSEAIILALIPFKNPELYEQFK
ncbi:inosine/xanthosine triphosphatase [Candidatus Beckwithbacteria bacterium]|nr:inosine/xanthosine triphosphatase [Candidatus Beckwithbacteria bacterium]